jgi:hypothetical protein
VALNQINSVIAEWETGRLLFELDGSENVLSHDEQDIKS